MLTENTKYPNRQSVRLKHFDYSGSAYYFITLCVLKREYLFGEIAENQMCLNELGKIVEEEWLKSSAVRGKTYLDEYVIMPNHLHALVSLEERAHSGAPLQEDYSRPKRFREKGSLSSLVSMFKASATRRINEIRKTTQTKIWQRNFYEHVVRNEEELNKIRNYIQCNPLKWDLDEYRR